MQNRRKIKNIIPILFISSLLLYNCSNPIKQSKQKKLIEVNEIEVGMNCQNLTSILGGYRAITYFYLEKKIQPDTLANSFLLLSTSSKDSNQFFYLCDRNRGEFINIISSGKKHINDYDLIKIFKEPMVMLDYVLTVISDDSREYFYRKINLADYNLTLSELKKAFNIVEGEEIDALDREILKAEEMLKKKKEEEKKNQQTE
tara:strand:- start:1932 stop:2537 length:606 start_codon:yes stop_codon:yes gene_type:complete